MKKVVAMVLLLALAFGLFGCDKQAEAPVETGNQPYIFEYAVKNPMQYPDYTFDHEPTTDELREMAVKGMRDMLSIEWCTGKFMMYTKTGAVSSKIYTYAPEVTYAGLPYSNGNSSIFNWFEYYNPETGMLEFDGDGYDLNTTLGNTCTGSIMWGWSVVCHTLGGDFTNYQMTQLHGCIPVGDYTYPASINSYLDYGTDLIIDQNGEDKILECYALCLPADGLTSSPQNHGMMIIEPAHVVRNEDGTINAEESYLIIQDQRANVGDAAYTIEVDGENQYFTGRTYAKFTFQKLLDQDYIPCTTAEFAGTEPYEKPDVQFVTTSGAACGNLTELITGTLTCNYPMCIIKAILVDADGNEQEIAKKYLDKVDVRDGTARNFQMGNYSDVLDSRILEGSLESGKTYTLRLDVTASTGQIYRPVAFTVNG